MILSAQLMVDSGDFVVEHLVDSDENRILLKRFAVGKGAGFRSLAPDDEAFVYSHVKPKYDDGCIFMYQCIEGASAPI